MSVNGSRLRAFLARWATHNKNSDQTTSSQVFVSDLHAATPHACIDCDSVHPSLCATALTLPHSEPPRVSRLFPWPDLASSSGATTYAH
jgi:hypothetical protein